MGHPPANTDRIDTVIAAIVVFNFAWLAFQWLNPSWRAYLDYLKRVHLAGVDVFGVLVLTTILVILLIVQAFRRKSQRVRIHWGRDLLLVTSWVIALILVVLTHLPAA